MPYLPHTNPDHDEALVARLAADDLPADEPEGRLVRAWVDECPACAELASDLRAIAVATAALPPPNRTRDFRLTEADAARLRPRGWRGLVARFDSPTFAFTRPLAAGLATLGIAGLLLATLPAGFGGTASSTSGGLLSTIGNSVGAQDSSSEYGPVAPQPGVAAGQPSPAGSAAPAPAAASAGPAAASAAPAPAVPSAGASSDSNYGRSSTSSSPLPAAGGGLATEGGSKGLSSAAADSVSPKPAGVPPGQASRVSDGSGGGPSPLVVLSVILLAIAICLSALRIVARRIA